MMIICAAVEVVRLNKITSKTDTIIVHGLRHGDCYSTIKLFDKNSEWEIISKIEGFVLHSGNFLDRHAAYEYAVKIGQLNPTTCWYKDDNGDAELYSEDLY